MNTRRQLCQLLLLSWAGSSSAQPAPDGFFLLYDHAGLTRVQVSEGRLTYTWHTLRQGKLALTQSMDSYDRHEIVVWLTEVELSRFREWSERTRGFRAPFPDREGPRSYGSAFKTDLKIVSADFEQQLSWTGDSLIPEALKAAADDLLRLCAEIERSRRAQ